MINLNEIPKESGIYKIVNTINGKRYVGSGINLYKRIQQHLYGFKNGTHSNQHLLSAWNKYGADSFIVKYALYPENRILVYEQHCLDTRNNPNSIIVTLLQRNRLTF